jgi:hypothetical protein
MRTLLDGHVRMKHSGAVRRRKRKEEEAAVAAEE